MFTAIDGIIWCKVITFPNLISLIIIKDGAVRTLDVTLEEPRILDQIEIGREISSLTWSSDFEILGVGSRQVIMNYAAIFPSFT